MATTVFSTSDSLAVKAYEEKLFRDIIKQPFFSKFMGSGPDALVQTQTKLEKGPGDRVTVGLRMRASGAGVTGTTILEGNEESLLTYSSNVTLEQYRHAIRVTKGISEQRVAFSVTDEAEQAIKDWGTEKIDSLCFSALATSPSKVFYKTGASTFLAGSAATAKAALSSANSLLTPNFISFIKAWAKTGGNRQYVPLRGVKVDGKEYYVLLVHPDVMFDLKVDSTFQQALRDADVRGKENPLFTGAVAIYDGVVIKEHENVTVATDGGGASVPWAACTLMGAQSLIWAWGTRPRIITQDFDYENQTGYAINMTCGVVKPTFNSLDYGSLGVYLARTNVSGV